LPKPIEDPPGFIVRTEVKKAAFDNGFRVELGWHAGWAAFASTTAQGQIFVAGAGSSGPWYLGLDHRGVVAEVHSDHADLAGPGLAHYKFSTLAALYDVISTAWRLGVSLPGVPLRRFEIETTTLPRTTEAERLVVQRVGQDIFREALLEYWQGCCPLTGIADPALLRASHIVRWAECESDAQRLDVHNGLLLSALWDAAFDAGLVSFDNEGRPLPSTKLGSASRVQLALDTSPPLGSLTPAHRRNLAWHRAQYGFG
jgi:hypothetical protein